MGQRGKSRWSLRRRRSSRRHRRRTLTPRYTERSRRRKSGLENLGFARHRPQPTVNVCEGSAGAVFVWDYPLRGKEGAALPNATTGQCDANCLAAAALIYHPLLVPAVLVIASPGASLQPPHRSANCDILCIEFAIAMWHGGRVRRNGRRLCGDATCQG